MAKRKQQGKRERRQLVQQAGWEAAKTHRLNRETFAGATGERLNEALDRERVLLLARGEYLGRNNPILEGVVNTYSAFLAGKTGPALRVLSKEAPDFNTAAERVWARWWAECDFGGISSGVDRLILWCCQNWTYGEFFEQLVTDEAAPDDFPKLRLRAIHPERLEKPVWEGAFGLGADGIELDEIGRRLRYWVREEIPGRLIYDHLPVPARDMLHFFEQREPGQLRGVPWMASVLPSLGDIHELDKSVLAAMRAAADNALVYETQPQGGDFAVETAELPAGQEYSLQRGSVVTAPMGWSLKQVRAEQPSLNHVQYRHDRLREVGRGRNIPLLHVLADGSQHNYSSMRGDNQQLDMALGCDRGKLERKVLNVLLRLVLAEASAMGLIGRIPDDFKAEWVWPVRQYIDPQKEAAGQNTALEGGTKTVHQVCAENGVDYDDHLATLEQEVADYRARGLVHPSERETRQALAPEVDEAPSEEQGGKRGAAA